MYYLRTKAAAQAIQFTVDKAKLKPKSSIEATVTKTETENLEAMVCSLKNKDDCEMCSG